MVDLDKILFVQRWVRQYSGLFWIRQESDIFMVCLDRIPSYSVLV
jgi:hypothetical protein